MSRTAVTVRSLVDSTLDLLYSAETAPELAILGAPLGQTDQSLHFTPATAPLIGVGQILEIDSALVRVTSEVDNQEAFVNRGYERTEAVEHGQHSMVIINPRFTRRKVADYVRRAFGSDLVHALPMESVTDIEWDDEYKRAELPEDTVTLLKVRYEVDGLIYEFPKCAMIDLLPFNLSTTGVAVQPFYQVPRNGENWHAIVQRGYQFTGLTEDDAVTMYSGTENVIVLWAALYASTRMEASKLSVTQIEQQENAEDPFRTGISVRYISQWSAEYQRALSNARIAVPTEPITVGVQREYY